MMRNESKQTKTKNGLFKWASEVWFLSRPYWTSKDRWIALGTLMFVLSASVFTVYQSVLLNRWYQEFYDIAPKLQLKEYLLYLFKYVKIATPWIAVGQVSAYVRMRLSLRWREWMTHDLSEKWLLKHNHYFLQTSPLAVENPDQRLSEDVDAFIRGSFSILLDIFDHVITLASFIFILWELSGILDIPISSDFKVMIPGYLVWVSLIYAGISSGLVHIIARRLIRIDYDQQHYEANFRFNLVRIRENSEGVAFARGEKAELRSLAKRFEMIVKNYRQFIRKNMELSIFGSVHSQTASLFPLAIGAPRLISGQIKIGGLFQISNAFGKVEGSLSFLVATYAAIASWRAATTRLFEFTEKLKQTEDAVAHNKQVSFGESSDSALALEGVRLFAPNGAALLGPLNLKLSPQTSTLFHGPSGIGKSTLMRVVAGIWPFAEGKISRSSKAKKTMYLPQHPYLPLMSLREILFYPEAEEDGDHPHLPSESEMQEALNVCRLSHLTSQLTTKDQDWSRILSGGEKQRLMLARVFLQKPDWLFLDEATSAVDESTEAAIYEELKRRFPEMTIISMGHRNTLRKYHEIHHAMGPSD